VVENAFNPSTWEAETDGFLSSKASLVYRMNSRTARAKQRNSVSKKPKTNKQTNKQNKKQQQKPYYDRWA
jgi:hypothetical protein